MNGIIITYERMYLSNMIRVQVLDADRGLRIIETIDVRNETERKNTCAWLNNKYYGSVIRRKSGNELFI